MSEPHEPGHPVDQEIDDSQNPTTASPAEVGSVPKDAGPEAAQQDATTSRQREMLRQLQDMIDSLAREARPVMREFAAKSAELAALTAQRAGPLAAKAAEKTQVYGDRLAAKSKEKAAELRRQEEGERRAASSAEEPPPAPEVAPETPPDAAEGLAQQSWQEPDRG